ncbi:hypothetical protein, partial [Ramlibacter albus]|uniref:hypothetical protein n=1 Tax=Ramlibacter albus TaxID=2079448 RepID=UPI001C9B5270
PRRAFVASDARRRGHLCTVGNPHGIHLKIGESCSDKRSHFCPMVQRARKAHNLQLVEELCLSPLILNMRCWYSSNLEVTKCWWKLNVTATMDAE